MSEQANTTAPEKREHTYQCPKCQCEFTRAEGEPQVCKCSECGTEVNAAKSGCACC